MATKPRKKLPAPSMMKSHCQPAKPLIIGSALQTMESGSTGEAEGFSSARDEIPRSVESSKNAGGQQA